MRLLRPPTGSLRLATLAAFTACLNPQPDDNPLNHPNQAPAAPDSAAGAPASDPSPVFDNDEIASRPATPSAPATELPLGYGGSAAADAGAPSPIDDAGTQPGVEGDAAAD